MPLTNLPKPTTSFANLTKVSFGETWGTIPSTWASETRSWLDTVSLFTNVAMSATDPIWSSRTFPWTQSLPWQFTAGPRLTNISKPS